MEAPAAQAEFWPQVVIVGGGFGGLSAAKELAGKGGRVTLVDRTDHHLFQPLLYQTRDGF
jgi:NADH:ubiquinone reductase (H+-translocating)